MCFNQGSAAACKPQGTFYSFRNQLEDYSKLYQSMTNPISKKKLKHLKLALIWGFVAYAEPWF